MKSVRTFFVAISFAVATSAPAQQIRPRTPAPAHPAAALSVPQLGDEVPDALLKRASAAKPCDVGDGRTDPCTTLAAGRDRITVAWDSSSHRTTYLYSTTLDTDQDIRPGDLLAIDPDSPITPFPAHGSPHRFVTVDWCDTDRAISGEALWCAVMVPTHPRSGKVVGFVQSLYLYLPEWDPEPLQKTSFAETRSGDFPLQSRAKLVSRRTRFRKPMAGDYGRLAPGPWARPGLTAGRHTRVVHIP